MNGLLSYTLDPNQNKKRKLNDEMSYVYTAHAPLEGPTVVRRGLLDLIQQFQSLPELMGPLDEAAKMRMQQMQLTPEQIQRMLFIP